ncbi:MAG: hypothetical protein ACI90V_012741, partial [Bacillariaceae sp.]
MERMFCIRLRVSDFLILPFSFLPAFNDLFYTC